MDCWHNETGVIEMNAFYDKHIKGGVDDFIMEHMNKFSELLPEGNGRLLDLGCGTGMLSDFKKNYTYYGADLPHIIYKSAIRNYPKEFFRAWDVTTDDLEWIGEFNIVVLNALIDVMETPLKTLDLILRHAKADIIIHRQEITKEMTKVFMNGSYGGHTYHSIINRDEFLNVLDLNNYAIEKEVNLSFSNWENGGNSFLLKKRDSWALNKMDYTLYDKYFRGKTNGFYIEAGANDGLLQNNTMFFEKYMGWKGILIEPFNELLEKCKENRSGENIFVLAALVREKQKEIDIIFTPSCDGLMSIIDSPKARARIEETGIGMNRCVQTMAYAKTLNEILEKHNPPKIDLLVLDIEGYEAEALKGLNLKKWKIDYILVEELTETDEIKNILKGYERIDKLSDHDYLYKLC
jgi:FkbM family methyltransferase